MSSLFSDTDLECLSRLLNTRQAGFPLTQAWLTGQGVDVDLLSRLCQAGFLHPLDAQTYRVAGDQLLGDGLLSVATKGRADVHLAGHTALAYHRIQHNLAARSVIRLMGNGDYSPPAWAGDCHYRDASGLFDFRTEEGERLDLDTRPPLGGPFSIRCASRERALLELLYDEEVFQDRDETQQLILGITNCRAQWMGPLLARCQEPRVIERFYASFVHQPYVGFETKSLFKDYHIRIP